MSILKGSSNAILHSDLLGVWFLSIQSNKNQDRQCKNNVTLRRLHATIVAMDRRLLHNLNVCNFKVRHPSCAEQNYNMAKM